MLCPPSAACFWRVNWPSTSSVGKYSERFEPTSAAADFAWNQAERVTGLLCSATSSTCASESVAPFSRYSGGIAGTGGGVGGGSLASAGGCQGLPGAGETALSTERPGEKEAQPAAAARAAAARSAATELPGFLFMRSARRPA